MALHQNDVMQRIRWNESVATVSLDLCLVRCCRVAERSETGSLLPGKRNGTTQRENINWNSVVTRVCSERLMNSLLPAAGQSG